MEALRSLDRQGIVPTAFTLREPSLDDVFLALTGRRAEVGDGTQEDEENGGEPDHDSKPTDTTADRRSAPMPAETNYAGGRS
jgi:oleandomycin transport system ATP-binding protein